MELSRFGAWLIVGEKIHVTHQPRVKIVFSVLTCTIARGPSHAARAFAEDRHAVTSRRTCS